MKQYMRLLLLIIIAIFLLSIRFIIYYQNIPTYHDGQHLTLQVTLQENPEISNRGQQFVVKTTGNQRISIRAGLAKFYQYGDTLAIDGQLQVKKFPNNHEFLLMNFPKIVLIEQVDNPFFEVSNFIRQQSMSLFEASLPPVSANLLLGIVFGAKGNFEDEFFEHLRSTGVLHVIAASGMNVSFFTGAVMFSLGSFLKRRIAIILSIFAVIFYSFVVGFEPSIIRASLMALIAFIASFLGRQNLAMFALFLTATGMLFWSPTFLFDVGFQLSFMATLGILLISPRLGWLEKLGTFGEDLKTTLSAQITTLPILLGTFGSVGVLGILVNVLILWTIPILMLLGTLGVITGLIFAPVGKLILFLSLPFLLFFENVVTFFGGFHFNFVMEEFPWELGVGYYLIVGALLIGLRNQKSQRTNV